MRCDACGAEIGDYAIFCPGCGVGVRRPEKAPRSVAAKIAFAIVAIVGSIIGLGLFAFTIYLDKTKGSLEAICFILFVAMFSLLGIWLFSFVPAGKRFFDSRGYRIKRLRLYAGFGAPICFFAFAVMAVVQSDLPHPAPSSSLQSQPDYAGDRMDEAQYRAAISRQSETLAQSMRRFSKLTASPKPLDPRWHRDIATELGIWKSAHQEAVKFNPPSGWNDVNNCYCNALGILSDAADKYGVGIEHYNSRALDEGTSLFNAAISNIDVCTKEIHSMTRR